jgi:hypothetical protein
MPIDSSLVVIAAAAIVLIGLVASSAFIGFHVGRRAVPENAGRPSEKPANPGRMPERVVRELHTCLDLADFVARDAAALAEKAERLPVSDPREIVSAISQLRKTLKGLIGRLQQVAGDRLTRAEERRDKSAAEQEPTAAPHSSAVATGTMAGEPAMGSPKMPEADNPENLRKFERKPCAGTLKATIYPPPFRPEGEPLQCEVITRDLSCGGVGITHTEQLYPRQVIVLHAVTKVLIGEVRWCQKLGECSFIAGCQLVKTGG